MLLSFFSIMIFNFFLSRETALTTSDILVQKNWWFLPSKICYLKMWTKPVHWNLASAAVYPSTWFWKWWDSFEIRIVSHVRNTSLRIRFNSLNIDKNPAKILRRQTWSPHFGILCSYSIRLIGVVCSLLELFWILVEFDGCGFIPSGTLRSADDVFVFAVDVRRFCESAVSNPESYVFVSVSFLGIILRPRPRPERIFISEHKISWRHQIWERSLVSVGISYEKISLYCTN